MPLFFSIAGSIWLIYLPFEFCVPSNPHLIPKFLFYLFCYSFWQVGIIGEFHFILYGKIGKFIYNIYALNKKCTGIPLSFAEGAANLTAIISLKIHFLIFLRLGRIHQFKVISLISKNFLVNFD